MKSSIRKLLTYNISKYFSWKLVHYVNVSFRNGLAVSTENANKNITYTIEMQWKKNSDVTTKPTQL